MKSYVLGFMFNPEKTKVCLIQKTKPDWQSGRVNGLGGHIEEYDETPEHAMVREFEEEVGLKTNIIDWKKFAIFTNKEWIVHVFKCFNENIVNAVTKTEEQVIVFNVGEIYKPKLSNVNWLIEMALDNNEFIATIDYKNAKN